MKITNQIYIKLMFQQMFTEEKEHKTNNIHTEYKAVLDGQYDRLQKL